MNRHKVIISGRAFEDMANIKRYIRDELKNSDAAEKIIEDFYDQIRDLSIMPKRHALINDEIISNSYGIRKVMVGIYYLFYKFDESAGIVLIVRVLYQKREWSDLLSEN